tara:strand:+ start:99273 stop:99752 length:480 start_codon:yes stop_codon:yes gene_type:complete
MSKFAFPIRYAIAIGGLLIAYFLIISLFGWHTNPLFSLFNGVITGIGIYEVIKGYKLRKGNAFEYSDGFSVGVVAGFAATIFFTFFFGVYAGNIAPEFLDNLIGPWGGTTSLGVVLFTVAIAGFATTIVTTLSFMQLFKPSWNTKKNPNVTDSKKQKMV